MFYAISTNPLIQPEEIQFLRYRNMTVRGTCITPSCVVVSWGSFTQSVSDKIWNDRSLFMHPEKAVLLAGDEAQAAAQFCQAQEEARKPASPQYRSPRP